MTVLDNGFWWAVNVPIRLAIDRALSPKACFLYKLLLSQCQPGAHHCSLSFKELSHLSGFGRNALRKYLGQLEHGGWLVREKRPGQQASVYSLSTPDGPLTTADKVAVSGSLIRNRFLSPAAKRLYMMFLAHQQGASGFVIPRTEMLHGIGFGAEAAVQTAIAQLEQKGWLRVTRTVRPLAHSFITLDPHLAVRESERLRLELFLEQATLKGEILMKELLNLLVDDDHFLDNARPAFLINPLTGERLEFDRWYTSAGVAFEFNGPQHYRPTTKYPDPNQVNQQQSRDLMKAAIAAARGIQLITVHAQDLTVNGMIAKIGNLLPLRELQWEDPVVRLLDASGLTYIDNTRGL